MEKFGTPCALRSRLASEILSGGALHEELGLAPLVRPGVPQFAAQHDPEKVCSRKGFADLDRASHIASWPSATIVGRDRPDRAMNSKSAAQWP